MIWLKQNWFKILVAILLFVALGNHPYSYYQILRWSVMIIGIYSAYAAHESKKDGWAWIFGVIAVLFNPIIPFYFSKETWQFLDLVTGIIFLINILFSKRKTKTLESKKNE